jgi:hypothetical protein
MGKILLIVGLIGLVLSGGVFLVSVLLPIINAPRTSWDEAMWGILPGGCCSSIFLVVAVVGLILMLTAKKEEPPRARSRRRDDDV